MNKELYHKMSMENKLVVIAWTFLGTSLITALQTISLILACLVSLGALFLSYPKIINRIKEIRGKTNKNGNKFK